MSRILKAVLGALDANARVRCVDVVQRAAFVTSRHAGMAYGFWKRDPFEGIPAELGGRLSTLSARELAMLCLSPDPFEASIGVATINSLLGPPRGKIAYENGLERALALARGRRLAVVGHFPFVERIRSEVRDLWVLELEPRDGDLPAGLAPKILPRADVVIITGTTLVNHTAEQLLSLARGKFIIMMGPTTILHPALFEFGLQALCGVCIEDSDRVQAGLKAGESMRMLKGLRRVTLTP